MGSLKSTVTPLSPMQTLLDILSGRKTSGTIVGDIRFGGVPPSSAFLQRYTGFVEQFGEAWRYRPHYALCMQGEIAAP